jgi:hypothetical protein
MELIPDWRNKNLKCHFCEETRSVKYKTKVLIIDSFRVNEEVEKEVCICNKCALRMIGTINRIKELL